MTQADGEKYHVLGLEELDCEIDYTTQSNLQIECYACQITKDVFHRIRTKNFTICIETQKTSNSQCSPFFKKDLFYILAVVGPCCCTRTFSSCFQRELFVAVLGLLTVVALLVVERRL